MAEKVKSKKKKRRGIMYCYHCKAAFCGVCKVCHNSDCAFVGLRVTNAEEVLEHKDCLIATQKAKGFVTLHKVLGLKVPYPYVVIQSESDVQPAINKLAKEVPYLTLFARPCPTRPRHGFEESKKVTYPISSAVDELNTMLQRAVAADEQGKAELLVIPYIESEYNAIITPNVIAVGPEHDGATAGLNSIAIPLMGVPFGGDYAWDIAYKQAGVDVEVDDPYFEVVYPTVYSAPYFTQLRAGAKVNGSNSRDFVPHTVRVDRIIHADGDLLEWEKQVKTIEPGTVVCKIGGTMISHYGVHCLYNNVPCLTSRVPEIGEVLEPIGAAPHPDPDAVKRGLADGALIEVGDTKMSQYLRVMMVCLHNAGAMTGKDGYWLGFAAAIMMRAGMAASHGEARHKITGMSNSRSYVYKLAFSNFHDARQTLGYANWMFKNLSWSSGYGGKKWAKCTDAVVELDFAIRMFLNNPTPVNIAEIVNKLNVAVNQAHNNGWWLNKFTKQADFDAACQQDINIIAAVAPTMFNISEYSSAADEKAMSEFMAQWKAADEITEQPGKLFIQEDDDSVVSDDVDGDLTPVLEDDGECDCDECQAKNSYSAPSSSAKNYNGQFTFDPSMNVIAAQAKLQKANSAGGHTLHIQYKVDAEAVEDKYFSTDSLFVNPVNSKAIQYIMLSMAKTSSWSMSGIEYVPLEIVNKQTMRLGSLELHYELQPTGLVVGAYSFISVEDKNDAAKETEESQSTEEPQTADIYDDCPF